MFELANAILWEREFPSGLKIPETLEEASKDFTYLHMDTPTGPVNICYPGNESGAIDTGFRNNVTFKTVKEWIEPRLLEYVKDKYRDVDVRTLTSANFGDDLCAQLRFGVKMDEMREMCKDICRKIIELFQEGPALWGLKTHASKGDIGWGRSEFIKIRSQRGKVLPNNILDPYISEKAPTINYSVQMKLATIVDVLRMQAFCGMIVERGIIYAVSMMPESSKLRMGELKAIPSTRIFRDLGLMMICPVINCKLINRFIGSEECLKKAVGFSSETDLALKDAYKACERISKQDFFQKSSELIYRDVETNRVLPKSLEMFSKENILRLTIAKATYPKIEMMERDQHEAKQIGNILTNSIRILNKHPTKPFDLRIVSADELTEGISLGVKCGPWRLRVFIPHAQVRV